MENQLSGKENQVEDSKSTIEHILPQKPAPIWDDSFPPNMQNDYTNRIGNYTLLESSINHKLSNEMSFDEKLTFYKKSNFKMTNDNLDFTAWSPETLLQHQEKMAKWAKGIWKSSYL